MLWSFSHSYGVLRIFILHLMFMTQINPLNPGVESKAYLVRHQLVVPDGPLRALRHLMLAQLFLGHGDVGPEKWSLVNA